MGFKYLNVSRDAGVERLTLSAARRQERVQRRDDQRADRGGRTRVIADATRAPRDPRRRGPVVLRRRRPRVDGPHGPLHPRAERRRRERAGADVPALDRLPVPVIGRIHGAALGGGAGLAAICDIVVAADDAVFGFTEVRLGLIPAVISPFVIAKIGRSAARELFLTGERFSAARAQRDRPGALGRARCRARREVARYQAMLSPARRGRSAPPSSSSPR